MGTAITKGKGIDDLAKKYSPQKVEEEKEIIINPNLDPIYKKYLQYEDIKYIKKFTKKMLPEIISPEDINTFVRLVKPGIYFRLAMGHFLSRLIQNSYDDGNNNFLLDLKQLPKVNYLGSAFTGTEENPLTVTVEGDVGWNLCHDARNANLTIHGHVISVGNALWTEFTLHGEYLENKQPNPLTNFATIFYVEGCTIRTTNRDTADEISRMLNPRRTAGGPSRNKLIYIHDDGEEDM